MKTLTELGWSAWFADQISNADQSSFTIGRVIHHQRGSYGIQTSETLTTGVVSGRFQHICLSEEEYPAVGDWVLLRPNIDVGSPSVIERVVTRKSCLIRKSAGKGSQGQVVAANVDTTWIVSSLNQEFNPRRIERYLTFVRDGGSLPQIVLTKSDLCSDASTLIGELQKIAGDAPIFVTSSITGEGFEALKETLASGKTMAIIGSSGVGKSTLVNRLSNQDVTGVSGIREADHKGRHTTTTRTLHFLPDDLGMLIDTPGMREIGLMDAKDGLEATFADIQALALQCKFNNCTHTNEPGCAVLAALEDGTLDEGRLRSFAKQKREQQFQERRQDAKVKENSKKRWKRISKTLRQTKKGDF